MSIRCVARGSRKGPPMLLAAALALLCTFGGARAKDDALYTCSQRCPKADFEFDIEVEVKPTDIGGSPLKYYSRQITGAGSPEDWVLAPTLEIEVGKTFTVRIKNNIDKEAAKLLGPPAPNRTDYVWEANPDIGGYSAAKPYGFTFYGTQPEKGSDMDWTGATKQGAINMPHSFDATNIHFHGLTITPHLFEPIGTEDADADFIKIEPGECYCYSFRIPANHPDGTFWYHIHHHGSSALQSWSGMAGMLIIHGKTDAILDAYPESQMQPSEPFVIWDPHYVPLLNASNDRAWTLVGSRKAARAYIITGDFLMDQNDRSDSMFLVNSDLAPNKTATAGQTVRYRVLCATTEALCMIKIKDPEGALLSFYVFASDGITQSASVKRDLIMLAGGYRNDILVQYPKEGRYEFVQEGLSHLQFFGMGPPNVTLAYVDVTAAPPDFPGPIDLEGELLPKLEAVAPYQGWGGKDKNIKSDEINVWRKWDFALFGNMSQAPFPQFMINKLPFNLKRIVLDQYAGVAEEWILTNPNFTAHPFHIHIFPFQIMSVKSGLLTLYANDSTINTPAAQRIMEALTTDVYMQTPDGERWVQWRDTVVIPAYGEVRIRIRFDYEPGFNLNGKTVFHCHFLPHEDTGMITSWRMHEELRPFDPESEP